MSRFHRRFWPSVFPWEIVWHFMWAISKCNMKTCLLHISNLQFICWAHIRQEQSMNSLNQTQTAIFTLLLHRLLPGDHITRIYLHNQDSCQIGSKQDTVTRHNSTPRTGMEDADNYYSCWSSKKVESCLITCYRVIYIMYRKQPLMLLNKRFSFIVRFVFAYLSK